MLITVVNDSFIIRKNLGREQAYVYGSMSGELFGTRRLISGKSDAFHWLSAQSVCSSVLDL